MAILLGACYALVGIVFGALAGDAASSQGRLAWRWAAWGVSAAAFAAHVGYERLVRRRTPRGAAMHAALAAALGAFGLAVAANVHRISTRAGAGNDHATALALSLVLWPALVFVPAFVVALVAAEGLTRAVRHGA